MSEPGANLAAMLEAWTSLLRTGSTDELGAILDGKVVWDGVVPEARCSGRSQVLRYLRVGGRPPRLTRVEADEAGDDVVISVDSPDFEANEWLAAGAPRSLRFTFRDGRVVRMRSFPNRDLAFAAPSTS